MENRFRRIITAGVFVCGWVMHMAFVTSHGAAWSYLISSVNDSPWEMVKPFLLSYSGWVFIELSCLRPSLLHFVSAKILCLHCFLVLSIAGLSVLQCIPMLPQPELFDLGWILIVLWFSQWFSYRLFHTRCRFELLMIPLLLSFGLLVLCILFFTFYPPAVFFTQAMSSVSL